MRHWLLTNTTYGTWLPGDPRGSVTSVRERRVGEAPSEARREHDLPGEPWEEELPGLYRSSRDNLKGPPIWLQRPHAEVFKEQLLETAAYRKRKLWALSIMTNHFHLVVAAPGDPDPKRVLADFKAYGTRALNLRFGRPLSETWWTNRGSKRKLRDERAIAAAVKYVLSKQTNPLVTWAPAEVWKRYGGEA